MRLFVDGIEDTEARVIGKPPGSIAVANRPLAIGGGYKNSLKPNAHRFEGSLTEVRLYDRALELIPESEEIQKLQLALHKIDDKQSAASR